ncbi:MAG: hypothetical protein TEF_05385 [Rhizobiales bacterium NRL2]|jgi:hypothetical protein|nr:MAG: hypothetical protein TEF_05385 [Rhizobiales bacterium NRL2]
MRFPGLSIVTVLLSAFLGTVQAACGASAPQIGIALAFPAPGISHELASDEIPQAMRAHGRGARAGAVRQVGATAFTLNTEVRMSVAAAEQRRDCFRLKRLDIRLDVLQLDVFIASELVPGTCPYRVTMAHEQRHVEIYRSGVRRLKEELETALGGSTLLRAIPAASIEQAMERFRVAVDTVVSDARRKNSEEMARDNARLDTPSSYREEHARCPASDW